jgi:hypothetical protein
MTGELSTYSQRVSKIVSILGRVVDLSKYAVTTRDPNPIPVTNGLHCSWGDPETGLPRLSVNIRAVDDMRDEVRSFRDDIAQHSLDHDGEYDPARACEVPTGSPNEHVFLFNYLRDLRALVGCCDVGILVCSDDVTLRDLVDAALEIGRTVGCSPYVDDFVGQEFPEKWSHRWTAFAPHEKAEER